MSSMRRVRRTPAFESADRPGRVNAGGAGHDLGRNIRRYAEIVIESTRLPPPIHDDPADQIIVASARSRHAAVLTADRLISTYPHVRSIW